MAHHSFTLYVTGVDTKNEHYEDSFYNAGCTDAMIAVVDGQVMLDFSREAPSYDLAVRSATSAVERAGARVTGVEPIRD